MPGEGGDYATIAAPVTSAQVAKAWVRPDRSCGGAVISTAGENIGDLVMGGKEALNLPRRLEPPGPVGGSFRPGY
jgi:hypothetical protein